MKKKTLLIKTADLCIRIHYKYPYIEQQCETWRVNEGYEPDIEVSVTDEEIETEYAGYRAESVSRALCESTCIYRAIARKLIAFQAFVMHGAVLELDGKAYVFTAKSGVGKTTHTKLWVEYFEGRASYINGDKPIIRCKDGVWYAYGTPWMGKEKFGSQSSAPIQAVCFIERGEENKIQKIADKEVIDRVFHQLFFPEDPETLIEFMDLQTILFKSFRFLY